MLRASLPLAVASLPLSILAAARSLPDAPPPAPAEVHEVRFANGDVELLGTLLAPEGDDLPAVVVIHGSGDSDRSNPWTAAWAEALAARGVAVLHTDKRGSGQSGGDWKTASLQDLAGDAVAAAEFLAADGRIDAARIGVIGFSQGGHVAPLAAKSERFAFGISISGSVVPLLEQARDEIESAVERAGVDGGLAAEVLGLHDLVVDVGLGRRTFADYAAVLEKAKAGPLAGSPLVEKFPARPDHWVFGWMRRVADPAPPDPLAA